VEWGQGGSSNQEASLGREDWAEREFRVQGHQCDALALACRVCEECPLLELKGIVVVSRVGFGDREEVCRAKSWKFFGGEEES